MTAPAVLATLAVLHPGAPVTQVDLHDGAVWLTSTSALKLGRYNPAVGELNAGLVAGAASFDVLQDADDVLLREPGALSVVDPASVTLAARTALPAGAEVSLAGGTVAVSADGSVWARPVAALGDLSTDAAPDLDLGPGGRAVVTAGGAVLGVEADGDLRTARVGDGGLATDGAGRLPAVPDGPVQVTAVGEDVVVLDGRRLLTAATSVDLSAHGDVVLQQPGPAASSVLVATTAALLEVPLDGRPVRAHPTGSVGRPAAPVRVGGCGHGAWASAAGSYLRLCADDATTTALEGMTATDRLVFRVNRDVVVLNDTLHGRLWAPLDDPELREPNWQDIEPEETAEDDEQESQDREGSQNLQVECTTTSAPPTAVDDDFGVRAGRTTVLSVIDNDARSDCGILVISEHDELPEDFGTVVPVHGGRSLQLTTRPGAQGTATLTYTVTDGRGSSAPSTATVRLTVRGATEDSAPAQVRTGVLTVEQGSTATYDVLADFLDPDGDPLLLEGASVTAGGTVRTRPDGELAYEAHADAALGRQRVALVVSDGAHSVPGTLWVDVRPIGSVPPAIDPVHATGYVDEAIVVRPLRHVRTSGREPVRLAGVEEVAGAELTADLGAGAFTVTAPHAGTFYVPFTVTAAPQQATGVARIDVLDRPEQSPAPLAVLDRALLHPGGEVTVDPLANDVDPSGAVLVLQSVEVPPDSGLRVAVLKHQLLRITSTRVLDRPVTVRYTVSNGTAAAQGDVLVQPVPTAAAQQAPVVPHATVSVRTGGVVTVPVLEAAHDPDGDALHLAPELPEPLAPGDGLLFVSGDVLRYQAPDTPRRVRATFAVRDSAGNETAASLTVDVHASDDGKAPPRPRNLTARVLEGGTVRIPVPLTGIDADGDGVLLLGQDRAPLKGHVVAAGPDWLEYQALPGELGTDTFTYAVEDWVGRRAVATVRVGIAPRPAVSAEVVSQDDHVRVRPGQVVEVRVLANDVDTAGGDLALEPRLETAPGVEAHVEGRRVVVRTREEGTLQIAYVATNSRGGRDTAVLTVDVRQDAQFVPPVARDVVVPATETINRSTVEVDVLAVAENRSGPLRDLAVSVDPSVADVATVTPTGTVVVTLGPTARTLPYLLTNTDPAAGGLASYAFITVPALGDFPPVPRPGAPALAVIAGEELVISLEEHIQVAPGRSVRISDLSKLQATKSDGPVQVRDGRLVYRPQRGYAGPASVSVEVTDGTARDGAPRTRVISLPVTVLAAEDHPPTFTPSVLDVAPGEAAVRVDLGAFTSAPVGSADGQQRYTYRLTSQPPRGFHVALDGAVLTVAADPSVPKGTVGGVGLQVGYGTGGGVPAQVDFRVVASSRPLARVLDHQVTAVEGAPSSVPVLDGAFNPFAGPLTLREAVVETPGAGTATAGGSEVTVRPAAGFIGTMVTRYRVRDVTGDPAREVEGRVTVTVRGRPGRPVAPRVVETQDRAVVLAWDAPVANGEPITAYRVTTHPGGAVRECVSTTCTVDGLTNGTEYTFTVAARNAVDWSDTGPASAAARPDARPSAPAAPRLVRGDGQVEVTWAAPANPGSPISRYELEVSPAPTGGPATVTTTATSHTVTGLQNGTAYTVRVRAVNGAPQPGDWSPSSASATPARRPMPPRQVTASTGRTPEPTMTVRWQPPESTGGEPVTAYRVSVDGGWQQVPADAREVSLTVERGRVYAIAVQAQNAMGWSDSAAVQGEVWGSPDPVTGLTGSDAAHDGAAWGQGRVELVWRAPADTGGQGITIEAYRVEVGGTVHETTGTSWTARDLLGGDHTATVTARNSKGEWSAPAHVTVRATTVPQAVTLREAVTSSAPRVVLSWEPGATGGAPVTGYRYEVEGDGPRSRPVSGTVTTTSVEVEAGSGEQLRVRVWAMNARGESAVAEQRVSVPEAAEPSPPAARGTGG